MSSVPCGLETSFESVHDAVPGPVAPSVQLNVVCTTCPTAYVVASDVGAVIDAVGGAGETVYGALVWAVAPAWLCAVTWPAY